MTPKQKIARALAGIGFLIFAIIAISLLSPFGGYNIEEEHRKREQILWDRRNSIGWWFGTNNGPRPLDQKANQIKADRPQP